jgi:16S rRNA processing protein RimM
MKNPEFFLFGTLGKPVGIKGEISLRPDVDDVNDYLGLGLLFIEISGTPTPFEIKHINFKNNHQAVVAFSEISSFDEASALSGSDVYLPIELLPKLEGNRFYFFEVINFLVSDMTAGEVGTIKDVLEYPAQPVLQVLNANNIEILIPVHDDIIVKIDRENQTMLVDLPEGLLDIYTNPSSK